MLENIEMVRVAAASLEPFTVARLIEALKEMPQDAPIRTEGCDCYGDVRRVIVDGDGDVLLQRGD